MNKISTNELYQAIENLVSIPSIRHIASRTENVPFGMEIRKAMDVFMEIAEAWGFRVVDLDGYVCYAEIGPKNTDYIGVLGHLDVVEAPPEGWNTPPFELTTVDGIMFGRGVNDDKGPLLGALYAAYCVYHTTEMVYPIRVIAGGAEETTWECMTHYFKHEKQPKYAFSPDGNFPIVNGEKGILQLELSFNQEGKLHFESENQSMFNCSKLYVNEGLFESGKTLSRNPHRSDHAVFNWLKTAPKQGEPIVAFLNQYLYDDVYGEKLGISKIDDEMGPVTVSIMSLNTKHSQHILTLDIRYHKSISLSYILKQFEGIDYKIIRQLDVLYVPEDSKLIKALQKAYTSVMHEDATLITKGGASYARVLDCGVAFGATFEHEDPKPHMPNENMSWESLLKAIEIYERALRIMVKDV